MSSDSASAVPSRKAILVLGMHRSGTSALTRVISLLGADLPTNLMPARDGNNEAGFWESTDIAVLNDQLLEKLGSSWDDWTACDLDRLTPADLQQFQERALAILTRDFPDSAVFVLKDPRICRLIGFWYPVLQQFSCDVRCVLSIRHPLEVAASLETRDGFVPVKSCLLWLRHMLDAELATRALPRMILPYDALLQDWHRLIEPMAQTLGLGALRERPALEAEIGSFLKTDLRHHAVDADDLKQRPEIVSWVQAAYSALLAMHADADSETARVAMDATRSEFDAASTAFGPALIADIATRRELIRDVKDLQSQLRNAAAEQGALRKQIDRQREQLAEAERAARAQAQAHVRALAQAQAAAKATVKAMERVAEEAAQLAQIQQHQTLALMRDRDQLAQGLVRQRHHRRWHRMLSPLAARSAGSGSWWQARWTLPPRQCFGVKLSLLARLRLQRMAMQLLSQGLFDPRWYLLAHPDILLHGGNPVWHWLTVGWREGRKPNAVFDTRWYLMRNPDVAAAGVNPLLHYLTHGADEGREPGPLFNAGWYLERNPDVARSGANPLVHYLSIGVHERRQPNPYLQPDWYLQQHPDVAQSGVDPLRHYLLIGAFEGRNPGPHFNSAAYLARNADVRAARLNPLEHYLGWGINERRAGGLSQAGNMLSAAEPEHLPTTVPVETFAGQRSAQDGFHNIAIFAHTASAQLFGGERSFVDILEMLASGPYNVHVIVPRRDEAYIADVARLAVEVAYIPNRPWTGGQAPSAGVIAAMRMYLLRHRIALVHVNTIMNQEPLLAAQRLGIPTATHVRESVFADAWLSQRIGLEPDDIVAAVLGRSDYIIANSPHSAAEFAKADRTFVVPNTFDMDYLDLANPVDPKCIHVGLISSNIPKKGLNDFAELARACVAEIPNLRFRLIGPHNEHVRTLELRQQAGELPMNLEFVGYQASPVEALSKVNIVLNLSHFAESFGRTVAEGLAARRPAITYDLGAVKDLLQSGQTGFVIPVGQWKEAIEPLSQLCANPERIVAMGEAGRAHVAAHYARESGARALHAAYSNMLGASPCRSNESVGDAVVPALRYAGPAPVLQPVRIAYFCWHFPVPSETFVLNELRELVARGIDVRVYCRQSPHTGFTPDFPIVWQQVAGVDDLSERLQKDERTVVHAHFTYPTVTDMVWPACERAQIPFTFIAHAQDIFKYENDRRNRVGELSASKWCRAVFVLGRFHRDYLIERGVPASKIIINPNAIDPSRLTYRQPRPRAPDERKRVCAIHRYTEKKGLRYLILAAKLLEAEDIEFNLFGYGEEEAALRALVDEHAISNVQFKGSLSGAAQIAEAMHQHDLFAGPSVRTASGDMDGIPTSIVEAMACGTPVITTALASIPDLVTDSLTGIVVEPADAASLADGIRRFFALDATAVSAMAQAARQAALSRHDVGKLASVLVRVWTDAPVDLVIVSWNNLPELREVVRRVLIYTKTPFHLTICDNASDEDVVGFLCALQAAHDNVTVVYRAQNSFVGPGTNAAVAQGSAPYVIYLCGKEGFVLAEGWETALISYMDQHPRVGLGGTLCYSPTYLTGADYPGIREFPNFREPGFAAANPSRMFQHVQGGLFIMRRQMLDEIGGFSDAVPHAYTDVEFSYYVEARGWQLGQIPGMLALYNKTRPDLWSRVDESVRVIHPPRLVDLPLLDRIAKGAVRFCNICEWSGEQFAGADVACPKCHSLPVHRSLYRYIAESTLSHRGLPARIVQPHRCLEPFLGKAFRLRTDDQSPAGHQDSGGAAGLALLMDLEFFAESQSASSVLADALRQLGADGELFIAIGDGESGCARVSAMASKLGYDVTRVAAYASGVVGYARVPILTVRKSASASAGAQYAAAEMRSGVIER